MTKKVYYILLPVLAVLAVGLAIYFDSSQQRSNADPHVHHHERPDTSYLPAEPEGEHLERILEIENILEDLDNERLEVAYLGEIVQINIWYDRFDGAGDATQRIAEITGEPNDWKDAGDYYFSWMEMEREQNRRYYFAVKAAESYLNALEYQPENDVLFTDLGVVYARVSDVENARQYFRKALEISPDNLIANFNLGVIFHETGNLNESISYLKRSLELAEGTEHEQLVDDYLNQAQIEI